MFRKGILMFIVSALLGNNTNAQLKITDTSLPKSTTIDELVVTATRTQKSIGTIPVPIQVITQKMIQQTGSQKLVDILQQQAGLILADNPLGQALNGYPNPFGSGIQMQGLDPAYTLILLDGEPLTGRNAGILNLGRIAVGNIKQIEIVKGPATSLYGSDALAGVINIITQKPLSTSTDVQLHHSSNSTFGITANAFIKKEKAAYQFFVNRYSSAGYDLDPTIYGKTSDPFRNYSLAGKLTYDFNNSTQVSSSVRMFSQKQFNNYLVYVNAQPQAVQGSTTENDWSINNQLFKTINEKVKLITRLYATSYQNSAAVYLQNNKQLFDKSYLNQLLVKPEVQVELGNKTNQKLIAGLGYNYETIDANRYDGKQHFNAFYAFTQKEWLFNSRYNLTIGARVDKHTLYKVQFNPKLATAYKLNKALTISGSIGTGFKAPDFRQQFLNFSNTLVGYTLLGATELASGLQRLKSQGQIDSSININPWLVSNSLLPEKSVGINAGFRLTANKDLTVTTNFFRNDISNLIDRFNLPFTKVNNQAIFSYANFNRVFTSGIDGAVNYNLTQQFSIGGGYQYLIAKDKSIIEQIKNNQLVKRDPVTYVSSYVTQKEYGGLFNRSKHTANLQFAYHNKQDNLSSSVRATYRSRFGFSDINGNAILDDDREYTAGYTLLNASVSKTLKKGIALQVGSDNILNHKDKDKLPNLFGRSYFINCNINLTQLLKNK